MPDFDDDNAPFDAPVRETPGPAVDLREAANEVRQQRQDDDVSRPASLEDGNTPPPLEETVEINYLDRQNAPEKVSLKKAATDLGDYRAQQKQAAEDQLEIERLQTTEADPQQRAAEQQQWEAQQRQAQQQAQQPTPEQVTAHLQAHARQAQQLFQEATAQSVRNFYSLIKAEFGDVASNEDVARLASQDPVRFARFQQLVGHLRQTDLELRQMQAHQQQQEQEAFKQYAKHHDDRAVQEIPELQRPEIKDHFKAAALETLRERGFADEELSRGYHGKGLFSLRDSRVQQVIADATRWRQAQTRSRDVTKRPLPPVQRPGVTHSRYDHAAGELGSLSQRLGRTGNLKDAAKLLAAQRRAGR